MNYHEKSSILCHFFDETIKVSYIDMNESPKA